MFVLFGFVAFIFIKFAAGLLFYDALSVLTALLMAISLALAMLAAQLFSAKVVAAWVSERKSAGLIYTPMPLVPMFGPFFIATLAAWAAGLVIIFGFSPRLAASFRDESDLMSVFVLVGAPSAVYYLASVWFVHQVIKRDE